MKRVLWVSFLLAVLPVIFLSRHWGPTVPVVHPQLAKKSVPPANSSKENLEARLNEIIARANAVKLKSNLFPGEAKLASMSILVNANAPPLQPDAETKITAGK
jgi:hypothetical protein